MTRARIAAGSAGAVLVLLLAGLWACEASGWRFLRQPLQDGLARVTDVPVRVAGHFRAHLLWNPRLEVGQLTVGAPDDVPVPHLLDGRNLVLEWRWSDLWRWRGGDVLRLRRLQAEALDVHLMRSED